jgi:hypothetical protein
LISRPVLLLLNLPSQSNACWELAGVVLYYRMSEQATDEQQFQIEDLQNVCDYQSSGQGSGKGQI